MSEASRAWARRASRIGLPLLVAVTPATTLLVGAAALALFGSFAGLEAWIVLLPAYVLPGLVALGVMHRVAEAPKGWRRALLLVILALGAVSGLALVLQDAVEPVRWVLPAAVLGTLLGGIMALPALPLLFPAQGAPQGALRIVAGALLGVASLFVAATGFAFLSGDVDSALTGLAMLGGAILLALASLTFIVDGVAARGATTDAAVEREIEGGRRALDEAFVRRAMDERERSAALLQVDRLQRRLHAAVRDGRSADATATIARVLVVSAFLLVATAVLVLTLLAVETWGGSEDVWAKEVVAPASSVYAGYAIGTGIVLAVSGVTGRVAAGALREKAEGELRAIDAAARALREEALHATRERISRTA